MRILVCGYVSVVFFKFHLVVRVVELIVDALYK
jgi:hypothetical protein